MRGYGNRGGGTNGFGLLDFYFAGAFERSALFDGWHQAMHSTASRLLARAQSGGAIDADLRASDLLVLASGIAVATADDRQAERCLAALRHGTAPQSSNPPSS